MLCCGVCVDDGWCDDDDVIYVLFDVCGWCVDDWGGVMRWREAGGGGVDADGAVRVL